MGGASPARTRRLASFGDTPPGPSWVGNVSRGRTSTLRVVGCLPMSAKQRPTGRLEIMQGTLDLIVLRTLRWGPMHGHGIAKFIERTSGETFRIDHGSLYPALQRLLQEGWVTADWGMSKTNRRARFYRLTPTGRKQLSTEHTKWERFSEAITRILSPLPAEDD